MFPLPVGLPVVVLEIHFAIEAVVEHRHRAEDLVRLAHDGHHVADEDLLQRLHVEFARGRLVYRQNLSRDGIASQPLLDEINELHLLIARLAGDEILLRFQPPQSMNSALGKASRSFGYAMPAALNSLAASINSRFADGKNL